MDENVNDETIYLPTVEVKAYYREPWVFGQQSYGYFRLLLADPDPLLGSQWTLHINAGALTRDSTLWLSGFHVNVAREMSTRIWQKALHVPLDNAINRGSRIYADIHNDEIVVRKWREGFVNWCFTLRKK